MPSEAFDCIPVLQGTLDLIVLRTLSTMGPQHAYAIATRLQHVSGDLLQLDFVPGARAVGAAGTHQRHLGRTESNREAKSYSSTQLGDKALAEETLRWRRMSGLVDKLLNEGA